MAVDHPALELFQQRQVVSGSRASRLVRRGLRGSCVRTPVQGLHRHGMQPRLIAHTRSVDALAAWHGTACGLLCGQSRVAPVRDIAQRQLHWSDAASASTLCGM
jgi:hypothetical protein